MSVWRYHLNEKQFNAIPFEVIPRIMVRVDESAMEHVEEMIEQLVLKNALDLFFHNQYYNEFITPLLND